MKRDIYDHSLDQRLDHSRDITVMESPPPAPQLMSQSMSSSQHLDDYLLQLTGQPLPATTTTTATTIPDKQHLIMSQSWSPAAVSSSTTAPAESSAITRRITAAPTSSVVDHKQPVAPVEIASSNVDDNGVDLNEPLIEDSSPSNEELPKWLREAKNIKLSKDCNGRSVGSNYLDSYLGNLTQHSWLNYAPTTPTQQSLYMPKRVYLYPDAFFKEQPCSNQKLFMSRSFTEGISDNTSYDDYLGKSRCSIKDQKNANCSSPSNNITVSTSSLRDVDSPPLADLSTSTSATKGGVLDETESLVAPSNNETESGMGAELFNNTPNSRSSGMICGSTASGPETVTTATSEAEQSFAVDSLETDIPCFTTETSGVITHGSNSEQIQQESAEDEITISENFPDIPFENEYALDEDTTTKIVASGNVAATATATVLTDVIEVDERVGDDAGEDDDIGEEHSSLKPTSNVNLEENSTSNASDESSVCTQPSTIVMMKDISNHSLADIQLNMDNTESNNSLLDNDITTDTLMEQNILQQQNHTANVDSITTITTPLEKNTNEANNNMLNQIKSSLNSASLDNMKVNLLNSSVSSSIDSINNIASSTDEGNTNEDTINNSNSSGGGACTAIVGVGGTYTAIIGVGGNNSDSCKSTVSVCNAGNVNRSVSFDFSSSATTKSVTSTPETSVMSTSSVSEVMGASLVASEEAVSVGGGGGETFEAGVVGVSIAASEDDSGNFNNNVNNDSLRSIADSDSVRDTVSLDSKSDLELSTHVASGNVSIQNRSCGSSKDMVGENLVPASSAMSLNEDTNSPVIEQSSATMTGQVKLRDSTSEDCTANLSSNATAVIVKSQTSPVFSPHPINTAISHCSTTSPMSSSAVVPSPGANNINYCVPAAPGTTPQSKVGTPITSPLRHSTPTTPSNNMYSPVTGGGPSIGPKCSSRQHQINALLQLLRVQHHHEREQLIVKQQEEMQQFVQHLQKLSPSQLQHIVSSQINSVQANHRSLSSSSRGVGGDGGGGSGENNSSNRSPTAGNNSDGSSSQTTPPAPDSSSPCEDSYSANSTMSVSQSAADATANAAANNSNKAVSNHTNVMPSFYLHNPSTTTGATTPVHINKLFLQFPSRKSSTSQGSPPPSSTSSHKVGSPPQMFKLQQSSSPMGGLPQSLSSSDLTKLKQFSRSYLDGTATTNATNITAMDSNSNNSSATGKEHQHPSAGGPVVVQTNESHFSSSSSVLIAGSTAASTQQHQQSLMKPLKQAFNEKQASYTNNNNNNGRGNVNCNTSTSSSSSNVIKEKLLLSGSSGKNNHQLAPITPREDMAELSASLTNSDIFGSLQSSMISESGVAPLSRSITITKLTTETFLPANITNKKLQHKSAVSYSTIHFAV